VCAAVLTAACEVVLTEAIFYLAGNAGLTAACENVLTAV
jgi:hypothetical protein